jgi:DNA-directed RNA polymerase specialized sigma24 family protein
LNLAVCFAKAGYRTLAIDLDQQGNLSAGGVNLNELTLTSHWLLVNEIPEIRRYLVEIRPQLKLLPNSIDIEADDLLKAKKVNRELLLRRQLKPTLAEFDAIVIDTPPAMRAATVNAFVVADQGSNRKSDREIRVITHLATFRGESSFMTWVYRVAANALLTIRKGRMEEAELTFQAFEKDLDDGISDAPVAVSPGLDESLLLEEVKIGCTRAMLLCLDRAHRLAYILGEILELEGQEGAAVLELTPEAFRKRLSRARSEIVSFMRGKCGLFDQQNACRCRRRGSQAITLGRIDPKHLLFASDTQTARNFPQVLFTIRRLEEGQRAVAL